MTDQSENKEINAVDQSQLTNQGINVENQPKNAVEEELAECLKVDSDCESNVSQLSTTKEKHVPKTLKTRKAIIRKIQETSVHLGNELEIKSKRIHRMRKGSLDHLLKEQVARLVQRSAETHLGIPQEEDKRLEYAVQCLYKFDICVLKLTEKCVAWANIGVTVDGLASAIDTDSEMKAEVKCALRDFIVESDLDWVKEVASPTTRLLLCHLYPLCSVLRKKQVTPKRPQICPEMNPGLAIAKVRSVFRPPQKDSPREATRPPLSRLVKQV
jgi:hypothetical protein